VIILELIQARARRIAFHAAVASLIRRHGPLLAGRMLAASMGRPPAVFVDEAETVVVAYRRPLGDVVEKLASGALIMISQN
jgi:hypothetical protein